MTPTLVRAICLASIATIFRTSAAWAQIDEASLTAAARRIAERVLSEPPEKTNYRYELALEGVLALAQATSDQGLELRAIETASQLGITHDAPIKWEAQPFGCLTFTLYRVKDDEQWLKCFLSESALEREAVWRDSAGAILHPRGEIRGGGYALLIDAMQEYSARMARAGQLTSDESYFEDVAKQWKLYREVLRDPESGLWSQGKGWLKEAPEQLSPGSWSRGHGWLLRGLTATLEALPADHAAFPALQSVFQELCVALESRQQENGLWPTLLHQPPNESPVDISGSAMIATAFSKGLRSGWLTGGDFRNAAEQCFVALPEYVTDDARVLSVSPGPGPLQSEEDYLTDAFPDDNDHGLFAVLFAATEHLESLRG